MKIGRNEPCPCGSGKKYKKCCLSKVEAEDSAYHHVSAVYNGLVDKLMHFVGNELGEDILDVALDEFLLWESDDEELAPFEGFAQLFIPWTLFTWSLHEEDIQDIDAPISLPPETTIAEYYAQKNADSLNSLEKKTLMAVGRVPFSFCEITSVNPGRGFTCQDIFTMQTRKIVEHSGSSSLERGDILFYSAAKIDAVEMLLGLSPIKFPPANKIHLIDLRTFLEQHHGSITQSVLHERDVELREMFLDLYEAAFSPPVFTNTDGDLLEPRTLHFAIDDAQQAFEALHHLCATGTRKELLEHAEWDSSGRLVAVEIPWDRLESGENALMGNTLLGSIIITGQKMTVEVNSEGRARQIKDVITNALGDSVRHKTTSLHSLSAPGGKKSKTDAMESHNMLLEDPQLRAELEQRFIDHWSNWLDSPLPALKGISPREAAATSEGREKVQALLDSAASNKGPGLELQAKGIELARKELGL